MPIADYICSFSIVPGGPYLDVISYAINGSSQIPETPLTLDPSFTDDLNAFFNSLDLGTFTISNDGSTVTISTNSNSNVWTSITLTGSIVLPFVQSNIQPDVAVVLGCINPNALNYNPLATADDGSCYYDNSVLGCMDSEAINFNPNATIDDGTCAYEPKTDQDSLSCCFSEKAYNYAVKKYSGEKTDCCELDKLWYVAKGAEVLIENQSQEFSYLVYSENNYWNVSEFIDSDIQLAVEITVIGNTAEELLFIGISVYQSFQDIIDIIVTSLNESGSFQVTYDSDSGYIYIIPQSEGIETLQLKLRFFQNFNPIQSEEIAAQPITFAGAAEASQGRYTGYDSTEDACIFISSTSNGKAFFTATDIQGSIINTNDIELYIPINTRYGYQAKYSPNVKRLYCSMRRIADNVQGVAAIDTDPESSTYGNVAEFIVPNGYTDLTIAAIFVADSVNQIYIAAERTSAPNDSFIFCCSYNGTVNKEHAIVIGKFFGYNFEKPIGGNKSGYFYNNKVHIVTNTSILELDSDTQSLTFNDIIVKTDIVNSPLYIQDFAIDDNENISLLVKEIGNTKDYIYSGLISNLSTLQQKTEIDFTVSIQELFTIDHVSGVYFTAGTLNIRVFDRLFNQIQMYSYLTSGPDTTGNIYATAITNDGDIFAAYLTTQNVVVFSSSFDSRDYSATLFENQTEEEELDSCLTKEEESTAMTKVLEMCPCDGC